MAKLEKIFRFDSDGERIEADANEVREITKAVREAIQSGRIEIDPEAEKQMKEMGLTLDEVLSMMIGEEKH